MKKLAFMALAAFALAACQSNQYKIQGTGAGLAEGDTLYLMSDMMSDMPSDTLVVKDGKFELSGETDTTTVCGIIYPAHQVQVVFLREPGTIKIDFDEDGKTKLLGTKCNEALQTLQNSVELYSDSINKVADAFGNTTLTEEKQQAIFDKIKEIQRQIVKAYAETAEKNLDNELGYILMIDFQDDEFDLDKKVELIEKMPAKFQQREAIQELKKMAEVAKKTAIGQQMPEFTLNTPEGEPLNVMDEVKKNKMTILDFWASWCGPCRQEMPFMKELYAKYKDKGLGIVGISLDEDGDAWMAAIKELGIAWPQMSDLKGWQCEAGKMFQVRAIPFIAIADQNGTIVQKGLRGADLEKFISENLK